MKIKLTIITICTLILWACKNDVTKSSQQEAEKNAVQYAPEIRNTVVFQCYNNAIATIAKGEAAARVTVTINNTIVTEFKAEQVGDLQKYESPEGMIEWDANGDVTIVSKDNVFKGCKAVSK
jgi:hypothetical protein